MYSFQIVNIVMLLLLLHLIYSNSTMSARKAQMFGLAVVLTMMMIAAEGLSDLFATLGREYAVAASVSNALGFAFSPSIGLALAAMFRTDDRQRMILLTIPLLPNALLALSSPLTGLIFSVSDQNVYTRGPVFWVFVITYIYTIAIFIWVNIREVRRLRIREHHMLMMLCAIILIGTSLQVAFPQVRTAWVCVALAEIMYYIYLREIDFLYDPVTETRNRSAFERQLPNMAVHQTVGVIVFDVFRFKQINDQFGHPEGDHCLKMVARAIEDGFAQTGECYRTGGDEYTVLAPSVNEAQIHEALKRTLAALKQLRQQTPALPRISYGYRIYNRDNGDNILTVIEEADAQMYAYKNMQGFGAFSVDPPSA